MILIACADDKMGMAFNKRRQSRDIAVCEDIVNTIQGSSIWMDERSKKLFEGMTLNFVETKETADYCFLEFTAPSGIGISPDDIILYRWNRHYPADMKFDLPLDGYTLKETTEFVGNSHEVITKEVYAR